MNSPDTVFPRDGQTPGLIPQFPGDVPSWVRITRVVGPGTHSEHFNTGSLTNAAANTMKANGVLGRDAWVRLDGLLELTPLFWATQTINNAPLGVEATITYTLNGYQVGRMTLQTTATGPAGTVVNRSICQRIDPAILRYARRWDSISGGCNIPGTSTPLASLAGETTCPGINEVEASVRLRWGTLGPNGSLLAAVFGPLQSLTQDVRNTISVSGTAGQISFRAMSPVVMVHGIRATKTWFSPYAASPRGPTAFVGDWITSPFNQALVPYQAVDFDEDLIREGARNLACDRPLGIAPRVPQPCPDDLSLLPSGPITKVATAFGAKRVHIVAHSKGGLWSRAFLQDWAHKKKLIVLSLTTVDTPHHGSVNADLLVAVREAFPDLTIEQWLLRLNAPYSVGTPDLTTESVEAFNRNNQLLSAVPIPGAPAIRYASISADANIDNSCVGLPNGSTCDFDHLPTISKFGDVAGDESEGYEPPDPDVNSFANPFGPGQILYRRVFRVDVVRLIADPICGVWDGGLTVVPRTCVVENPAGAPQLNDFNVTIASARMSGFTEIAPPRKRNHTTIGAGQTGQLVLTQIQQVEAGLR